MVWNGCADIEQILENIRVNSVNLSNYHRNRFYHFKSFGKYFRIPIIVLSSITASASVGLQPVLPQSFISGLTCVLGFLIAVISSIEMYLGIQPAMDAELALSRDYYTLAIDIYKCLNLSRENRTEEPRSYLDKKYSDYKGLRESSSLLKHRMTIDLLATIPDGYDNKSDESIKRFRSETTFPNLPFVAGQNPPSETTNPLREQEITFGDIV
jgi:hypothetical protein